MEVIFPPPKAHFIVHTNVYVVFSYKEKNATDTCSTDPGGLAETSNLRSHFNRSKMILLLFVVVVACLFVYEGFSSRVTFTEVFSSGIGDDHTSH